MIQLSCGHREDNFYKHYNIMTKEWERDNSKAVGYKTVCQSCFQMYKRHKLVLFSDKEASSWISGE